MFLRKKNIPPTFSITLRTSTVLFFLLKRKKFRRIPIIINLKTADKSKKEVRKILISSTINIKLINIHVLPEFSNIFLKISTFCTNI